MRRLLGIVLLLCIPVLASCQEVIVADSVTLYWNAATAGVIPGIDTTEYDVFMHDGPLVNPQDAGAMVSLGRVSATQLFITLPYRAAWRLGVRVVMTTGAVEVVGLIGWSTNDPPITEMAAFIVVPNLTGAPMIQGIRAEE